MGVGKHVQGLSSSSMSNVEVECIYRR